MTQDVLIAQISRGKSRWGQANFKLSVFKDFLQLDPKLKQRVVLHPIDSSGVQLAPEVRESVSVKSNNYRFELGLARGHAYPANGRPIAVFLPIATREFRYRLVFPNDPIYAALHQFAKTRWRGPNREMVRVVAPYDKLKAAIPAINL